MIQEQDYKGWKSAVLSSNEIELIAPLDIGPRIMSLRFREGDNFLFQIEEELGGRNEPDHRFRGGHRLWHSPEHPERTYQLDNSPVSCEFNGAGTGFSITGDVEEKTGMRKRIEVTLLGGRSVRVAHRLSNEGLWPVECAAWPVTMLRRGGLGVIPFPPKGEHPRDLLPTWSLVPWTYTDLSAPCWKFHRDFLAVDSAKVTAPHKLGLTRYPGWSAYWLNGATFVKATPVHPGAKYPDLGSCMETFCNDAFIELESLGPLTRMERCDAVEHQEIWGLLPDLPRPDSEEAYRDAFLPAVGRWLESVSVKPVV